MEEKVEILVKGQLDKSWQNCFEGFQIVHTSEHTILTGPSGDSTWLYGILNKLRDLNIRLVSVNHLNPNKK